MKNINLSDYTYTLPPEKIASYGLEQRDQSKLLLYHGGQIHHRHFFQIPELLPSEASLFFNNTKVIQARLILKRKTGAIIEVFLLAPADSKLSIYDTLNYTKNVDYKCMIGNLKKWKEGEILREKINIDGVQIEIGCQLIKKLNNHVRISWNNQNISFSEIIDNIGHTPLPPYIKRPDEEYDKQRYQTVYSQLPGAVAAPTAGLHFTNEILSSLAEKGISSEQLTLHVSAGTFQPIKEENVTDHPMHSEQIILTQQNLKGIRDSKYTIAVGTTAMRTLESTYWYGVQLLLDGNSRFHIEKLAPYQYKSQDLPDLAQSMQAILDHMQKSNLQTIKGNTEIFIIPGYEFKVCNGLITNFHQPGSTLILLIAAFIGEDWQNIYKEALEKKYRFLSYGDSSLLFKQRNNLI